MLIISLCIFFMNFGNFQAPAWIDLLPADAMSGANIRVQAGI